jgi:4-diphosphocytidyl-2-C-methyl-D-erythritol kinase
VGQACGVPEIHRELARAKLTRTLRVLGRRADGYHTISSEMVTLDFADELEFAPGQGLEIVDAIEWIGVNPIQLTSVIGPGRNLVERALLRVGRESCIRLTKRVPPGAGLGGGSADAAAVLRWAGEDDLEKAARLGADVPFCLRGGHAMVGGIGDILDPLPMIEVSFVLLIPAFAVSTAAVYAAFDDLGRAGEGDGPNDLELAALAVEPRLALYRDLIREASPIRPQLAGSGASWFVECSPTEAKRIAADIRSALADAGTPAAVLTTQTAI